MKTATAPSPFTRAVDSPSIPEQFLPGDGGAFPATSPHVHARRRHPEPVVDPAYESTRQAALAAEERIAMIDAEEEVLSKRRAEILAFKEKADAFHAEVATSLEKLRQFEEDFAQEAADSDRCVIAIERTAGVLNAQLERIDRVHPDGWSQSRMKAELDPALNLLADVDHETETEMKRLERELPNRLKTMRNGWMGRCLYWLSSAFAFLLPLIAFVAIAVILVLTALGLV